MPSNLLSEFVIKSLYNVWVQNGKTVLSYQRNHPESNVNLQSLDPQKRYVIKVDQNIKGRMKKGLVKLNARVDEIETWINQLDAKYTNFIIEPHVFNVTNEIYLLIRTIDFKTEIITIMNGGIDVGHIDQLINVPKVEIDHGEELTIDKLNNLVNHDVILAECIIKIYAFYQKYYLTFLEINPLAIVNGYYEPLDMLAKYDSCSLYLWNANDKLLVDQGMIDNGTVTKEEKEIQFLGQKTGSSLKFKLLNPNSRVWFILFGGGASVCFFDKWMKIESSNDDLKPANYGELSGNPSREFVYEYTKQFFSLMNKSNAPTIQPYYLIIGGGIANFTLVDKTFSGLIDAINECADILHQKNVKIIVRRGGPNYQKGLSALNACCHKLGIYCETYGPEKPMTQILDIVNSWETGVSQEVSVYDTTKTQVDLSNLFDYTTKTNVFDFNEVTTCFIYGSQIAVGQNMLDFDMESGRSTPSVIAFIDPVRRTISNTQLFWKNTPILVPIYPSIEIAIQNHPYVNGMINFASFRTAYESTKQALQCKNIKFVSILAEGMAENQTKDLINLAKSLNKMLLGPSTIGAIFPGQFRIGNAGGKIENLISSKLTKVGKIGIVTRSGGLLNELCYVASKVNLGIASAIAIGGDRYTGTNFADVVKYYEENEKVKIIVLLGEIGGLQEIEVANLVKAGYIKKPIVGLCLGSSADLLSTDIQFGHAGADAHSNYEKATFKNSYMASVGIHVPQSWEKIEIILKNIAQEYQIEESSDIIEPKIILSFDEASKEGLVRKQANFFSSISNEKGTEVTYNQIPISSIQNIGDAIGHLWFKKSLPDYLTKYYEKILVVCADHGPCVSGAQNTMITTRAGKDMIASLCSGLLTIGPKFGGAINEAAVKFYYGMKNGISPHEFVKQHKIISGIGHKHYNIYQPDNRVTLLNQYVEQYFTRHDTITYAKSIEKITVQKKHNLILNVDGFIAVSMIDGFLSAGFGQNEIEDIINNDVLNAFFILARTIGFIGHHIDQKRLRQDLYRAPEYDVAYID